MEKVFPVPGGPSNSKILCSLSLFKRLSVDDGSLPGTIGTLQNVFAFKLVETSGFKIALAVFCSIYLVDHKHSL